MAVILEVAPTEVAEAGFAELAIVRGGITVKPHVQRFFDDLEEELGFELSLGTYNGHSPPEGPTQAVDFFNTVNAAGFAIQDRACAFFRKNAKRYGGRYCIRRHQIWNIERDDDGWREQGTTGNVTVDHMDHSHFTFYADAPINYEEPDPEPVPEPKGNVMAISVRYIWGRNAGELVDWVFDGASRIHAAIGDDDVLRACDLSEVKELGKITTSSHNWFVDQASKWRG